ncbi:TPA: hypothetical protein N0F65_011612 [Lagenidium giganteum]|uniref:Uncharacterized protein n=1 Tax=Lagenidium giganteum TaxID=4803 RepID=A0AAV2Z776_9STRA|nr:TPA: hypothetical protein N0F65_011612 [Lagenidium giganteum]
MNVVRHIVESHIIQSPTYAKLTNKEKADLHAKLLHSSYAANISYNKIANRNKQPEVDDEAPAFEYEPSPEPPSPAKPVIRSRDHDKSFDKTLFNLLDESEQDYMRYFLNKCKISSREFESAYNEQLDGLVKRLKILDGAKSIGDDNPGIKKEMKDILDKLFEKGVFSISYYTQFKRQLKL